MKILTVADKLLIAFLLVGAVVSFFLLDHFLEGGSTFDVEVDGRLVYRGKLSEETTFTVQGTKGEVSLQVRDGKISVTHADCPNKICMRMGERSRAGDMIVCVPNRTIVRIKGGKEEIRVVTGLMTFPSFFLQLSRR